ncbi:unnamed protein product [Acanthoscelides obtectus]|uniref:Sialin n=1 Tax=Acanthoscelides obtectus TaxID=200917 RepID=A0A9P0NZ97_ACAOB|nr:unnamed protein product [Acanthoscelides obtectus]CAK1669919.1 Sialin [Acanthoscelides obtectus]
MASATSKKWTDFLSCRQVLNIMVILGFMFNYMLRVNLTIAIVDMIESPFRNSSGSNISSGTTNSTVATGSDTRFQWSESQKNDILGSFFWGYVLTELPGGRMAEIVGARRIFGGGMLAASLLTILTPAACYTNFYTVVVCLLSISF